MLTLTGMDILDIELDLIAVEFFSFPGIGVGRNVIIFEVEMSSLGNIDNKKNDISVSDKGPTHGLEHWVQKNVFD